MSRFQTSLFNGFNSRPYTWVGKSIRDIKFRSRYNAVVLAVHR